MAISSHTGRAGVAGEGVTAGASVDGDDAQPTRRLPRRTAENRSRGMTRTPAGTVPPDIRRVFPPLPLPERIPQGQPQGPRTTRRLFVTPEVTPFPHPKVHPASFPDGTKSALLSYQEPRLFQPNILPMFRYHHPSSPRYRSPLGWLALGAMLFMHLIACASGELPARTTADPANPSAPEGAPAPTTSAAVSGSSPHAHHGHEGHAMPTSTASATPSATPTGQGHQGH